MECAVVHAVDSLVERGVIVIAMFLLVLFLVPFFSLPFCFSKSLSAETLVNNTS